MLPSPSEFAKEAGFDSEKKERPKVNGGGGIPAKGLSAEFRGLIVNYCAHCLQAEELSQINWLPLGKRLGCKAEFLEEAAKALDSESDGGLWQEVLGERIRRASAEKIFRDVTWERLESQAVGKLLTLVERQLVRDPGELLAIATTARKATVNQSPTQPAGGQQMNVNLNFGNSGPTDGDTALPAAGTKMTIDLSPRTANALMKPKKESDSRVIDGEMLSADELRGLLEAERQAKESSAEPVLDAEIVDSTEGSEDKA